MTSSVLPNATNPPTAPLAAGFDEVAAMFGISKRTAQRWNSTGRLPSPFRIGGRVLWRIADLTLWTEWGFPSRVEFAERLRTKGDKVA